MFRYVTSSLLLCCAALLFMPSQANAQATFNSGSYTSTYTTSSFSRGVGFVSPGVMQITGLRVPDPTSTGNPQNLSVWNMDTNTEMFAAPGGPSDLSWVSTSIIIPNGTEVCVFGNRGTGTNANFYGQSTSYSVLIDGVSVDLKRCGASGNINPNAITSASGSLTGQIGLVDIEYVMAVDNDNDGDPASTDCDDNDPNNSSIGTEVCDGSDNDCNGLADFDLAGEVDVDMDMAFSCEDCDDNNNNISPYAAEICDGIDNNCNGIADEALTTGVSSTAVSSLSPSNPLTITTSGGVTYTHDMAVANGITDITDVNMLFTANHTWSADLDVSVISAAGTEVLLATSNFGSSDDCYNATLFDDEGGDGYIGSAACGVPGSYTPEAPLSALDGEAADGTWTLSVTDTAGGDGGAVTAWELYFEGDALVVTDADGDGAASCWDCDDNDASTFPGNVELCDGTDNDCDALTEAAGGEGDADGDGEIACSDCDDNDANNFNGNVEACDGFDNDCNGFADFLMPMGDDDDSAGDDDDSAGDDDDSAGDDDDSAGDDDDSAARSDDDDSAGDDDDSAGDDDDSAGDDDDSAGNDPDSDELDLDMDGYLLCGDDCDDENDATYTGAMESCDGEDNDCDGAIPADEADADMDGQSECAGDCDDADATTNTGAAELCDGVDNDCDGSTGDEEFDGDGDGETPCEGDCDDAFFSINSGAEEVCDGNDNDCDGVLPDDEADADADGELACDGDCDDNDANNYSGNIEDCEDGTDNDCDGLVDLDDTDLCGGDDDDAADDDDDDDDDGGSDCNCSAASSAGDAGYGLLLLGLLGLVRRRRS